jgi:repressor LexA
MRLCEWIQEKLSGRGTQAHFARKSGISSGTVSKWAQGEMDRAPNFENCLRIAAYFQVPPEQIFEMAERPEYGKLFSELLPSRLDYHQEPTFGQKELSDAIQRLTTLYDLNPRGFRSVFRTMDDWLEPEIHEPTAVYGAYDVADHAEEEDEPVLSPVRYYDDIAAGNPFAADPPLNIYIEVPFKVQESWYALRVSGDSMEPEYYTGDIILMDTYKEPANGSVVAALIDGTDVTLKVYSNRGDKITLSPINKEAYKPHTYHASRVKIQGVLINIIRRTHV